MNILETVLKFDNHWKHPEADFTVSQIAGNSKQQLYLHSINTPKTHEIALEDRVSAQIGTGFHMRAEEALKDTSVITEHKMFCEIEGVKVSGTADVIYDNGLEDIVGDFKTMGWFQIKKLMRGETSKFVEQLSLYAYMYAKETKSPMATKGEIYVLRTGDNGFIGKNLVEHLERIEDFHNLLLLKIFLGYRSKPYSSTPQDA